MKFLLDTHTFLWFIDDNPKLSQNAKTLLEEDHELLLSIASLWEIAIKLSLGKLTIAISYDELMTQQLEINSIDILPITIAHLKVVSGLPLHHRDPFDRLLIAQSIVECIPIVSADSAFDSYTVERFW